MPGRSQPSPSLFIKKLLFHKNLFYTFNIQWSLFDATPLSLPFLLWHVTSGCTFFICWLMKVNVNWNSLCVHAMWELPELQTTIRTFFSEPVTSSHSELCDSMCQNTTAKYIITTLSHFYTNAKYWKNTESVSGNNNMFINSALIVH